MTLCESVSPCASVCSAPCAPLAQPHHFEVKNVIPHVRQHWFCPFSQRSLRGQFQGQG